MQLTKLSQTLPGTAQSFRPELFTSTLPVTPLCCMSWHISLTVGRTVSSYTHTWGHVHAFAHVHSRKHTPTQKQRQKNALKIFKNQPTMWPNPGVFFISCYHRDTDVTLSRFDCIKLKENILSSNLCLPYLDFSCLCHRTAIIQTLQSICHIRT